MYRYVFNNPVNLTDPDGLLTLTFGASFSGPVISSDGLAVAGAGGGAAVSFPFFDGAEFDFGFFGELKAGRGGGGALVDINVEFGAFKCSVQDLEKNDAELDVQFLLGGLSGSVDRNGNFRGGTINIGQGIGVSGTQTATGVISIRSILRSLTAHSSP